MQCALDRLTAADPPTLLRVEYIADAKTHTLRIAATPPVEFSLDDGSLMEAVKYARNHRGALVCEAGALVISIPVETGLEEV